MQGSWFVSHNSGDKETARAISVLLLSQGLRPWLDEWEIRPGDQIVHAINVGLDQAEGIVVVWSQNANQSTWVHRELTSAVHRSVTSGGVFRVVPVVLDPTPLPALLTSTAYVDWRNDQTRLRELLRGVGAPHSDRPSVLRGLVALIDFLGVEPKGMYAMLACPKCGSEDLKDGDGWDPYRGDHYGWTTCKACGWQMSGEI